VLSLLIATSEDGAVALLFLADAGGLRSVTPLMSARRELCLGVARNRAAT
jgi:hypothetical protein